MCDFFFVFDDFFPFSGFDNAKFRTLFWKWWFVLK